MLNKYYNIFKILYLEFWILQIYTNLSDLIHTIQEDKVYVGGRGSNYCEI